MRLARPQPACSNNRRGALAEVPAENSARVSPQPSVKHLGVDRSKIGFVRNVAPTVLERRVVGTRIEICSGAVDATAYPTANRHHQTTGAVVGSLAAVFGDTSAELRELDHQRAVEQPLVPQILIEGEDAVADRRHQRAVGTAARIALA